MTFNPFNKDVFQSCVLTECVSLGNKEIKKFDSYTHAHKEEIGGITVC